MMNNPRKCSGFTFPVRRKRWQYIARNRTTYRDVLTIEPGKRGGKSCIRGMRITGYDVLSYLAAGIMHEEILMDFPYLTETDIQACVEFANDNRDATDRFSSAD